MAAARVANNMTQAELGAACGTSGARMCRLEAGFNDPSLRNAVKIADTLGVSLDYLTGRTDGDEEMQRREAILSQIEELKAQL